MAAPAGKLEQWRGKACYDCCGSTHLRVGRAALGAIQCIPQRSQLLRHLGHQSHGRAARHLCGQAIHRLLQRLQQAQLRGILRGRGGGRSGQALSMQSAGGRACADKAWRAGSYVCAQASKLVA